MTTMAIADLDGPALDWAVAKCEGIRLSALQPHGQFEIHCSDKNGCDVYSPSTSWSQGGPLLERAGLDLIRLDDTHWSAKNPFTQHIESGPTLLVAAMRCYVESKMGPVVDVPDELMAAPLKKGVKP